MNPWLLIDHDDTLGGVLIDGKVLGNDAAYYHAIDTFVTLMGAEGFDVAHARELQSTVDKHLCSQHGFSWRPRFAESMVRTYKALASKANLESSRDIESEVYRIGMGVFSHRYMPLPGALSTLHALHNNYRIAIVTKGENNEQRRKVTQAGVVHFVDAVFPVGFKNEADWVNVMHELGIMEAEKARTWVIGNAIKSDINPNLRLGINAIHVDRGEWSFEKEEYETPKTGRKLIVVQNINEVLNHLPWS